MYTYESPIKHSFLCSFELSIEHPFNDANECSLLESYDCPNENAVQDTIIMSYNNTIADSNKRAYGGAFQHTIGDSKLNTNLFPDIHSILRSIYCAYYDTIK